MAIDRGLVEEVLRLIEFNARYFKLQENSERKETLQHFCHGMRKAYEASACLLKEILKEGDIQNEK